VTFLPEADQEFLASKGIVHELLKESVNGSERRGVLFPAFTFTGTLYAGEGAGGLIACNSCDLLVMIADGYPTTKLDSFYTVPRLKRPDSSNPKNADVDTPMFGRTWQFWSRHLDDADWRPGVDSLQTYLSIVRDELRMA
jgi:Prokaryotic E2 family E